MELVRERTEAVEVRLARRIGDVQPARIERVVPAGDQRGCRAAPSARGRAAAWAVDPSDPEGVRTLSSRLRAGPGPAETARDRGHRRAVYVRFDHGLEPLALRAYRGLRRLLLSRLSV